MRSYGCSGLMRAQFRDCSKLARAGILVVQPAAARWSASDTHAVYVRRVVVPPPA